MNAVKGVYNNGVVELLEKPVFQEPVEVLIIFPKPEKRITKIRGLCKDVEVDYNQIEQELQELSHQSEEHILSEWKETS